MKQPLDHSPLLPPLTRAALALGALLLATFAASCSGSDTAGTGSQAGNAIQIAALDQSGAPAAGARLRALPSEWYPSHPSSPLPAKAIDTALNTSGELELLLEEGSWTIELSHGEEGKRWSHHSAPHPQTPIETIQLEPNSSLSGTIGRKSGATAVAIAGTHHWSAVDSEGRFRFDPLAPGEATLLLIDSANGTVLEQLEPLDIAAETAQEIDTDWESPWLWNFGEEAIDPTVWSIDTGRGPNNDGWGNDHLSAATNRPQNLLLTDTTLLVIAQSESWGESDYTAGRLRTINSFSWKYGRFEARVRFPSSQGVLALLSLQSSSSPYGPWPKSGSIDIGSSWQPIINGYFGMLHWWEQSNETTIDDQISCLFDSAKELEEWQNIALEWRPTGEFEWLLNGQSCGTITDRTTPFDHSYHLRIELMVGGNPAGDPLPQTLFPQQLEIDWLSVSPWRERVPIKKID